MKAFYFFALLVGIMDPLISQTTILLPENPELHEVPSAWRGHNLAATVPLSWVNNTDFRATLPGLHPGIFRWPFGNKSNNYDWKAALNTNNIFNLREAAQFSRETETALQIVVNFGNGRAEEAANFVRFCNSAEPFWANERLTLLGNSEPLGVDLWEIGNEVTTAWGFGWSWLGFQENIFFRSGQAAKAISEEFSDSLYFYGGSFWREGWVKMIGGLNKKSAILGDLFAVNTPQTSKTFSVDFPELDTTDLNSVRVWLTPNLDLGTAETVPQQVLYDTLTQPLNLLDPAFVHWDATSVTIEPPSGIPTQSVVLIEYNSVHHDGAFAFRTAMKAADPNIQVGFSTKVKPFFAEKEEFRNDFAANAPDFMIEHPYATGLTLPAVENGLFSEMAYVPQFKRMKFVEEQQKWNDRLLDWNLPQPVGLAFTEWNVALCDECPNPHPFDGIAGALYVASFWANLLDASISNDLDIRAINHFALLASGNNFIHLFHVNNDGSNFTIGNEGQGTLLCMEAIGHQTFDNFEVSGMPQIVLEDGQGGNIPADALEIWGGHDQESDEIKLLIINRDDAKPHNISIALPSTQLAVGANAQTLTGTMVDDQMELSEDSLLIENGVIGATLPIFSISVISLKTDAVTSVRDQEKEANFPFARVLKIGDSSVLKIQAAQSSRMKIQISDMSGRVFKRSAYSLQPGQNEIILGELPKISGFYFMELISTEGWRRTLRFFN